MSHFDVIRTIDRFTLSLSLDFPQDHFAVVLHGDPESCTGWRDLGYDLKKSLALRSLASNTEWGSLLKGALYQLERRSEYFDDELISILELLFQLARCTNEGGLRSVLKGV